MRPRPDEALARHRQSLEQARNCVLIGVSPAADGVDRALDRFEILAYRSMLPVRIAALVLQPQLEEQRDVLQALQPHRPPAIADKQRVGRKAYRAEKEEGPVEPGGKQRAAHVVRIVGVAIVGRADGYDGLERRRAAGRNLKSIEPAPGDSHHPDNPAAPGLRRQPGYHLHAIVLLLLCILVEQQAVRLAAPSNVHANAGVAVSGQIGMSQRVSFIGSVALAVWEVLEDRGNRLLLGILGQPDAGRQHRTVFQRDQRVLDHPHRSGKSRDNHRTLPSDSSSSMMWATGFPRIPLSSPRSAASGRSLPRPWPLCLQTKV